MKQFTHVRSEWDKFTLPDHARVSTLCKRKVNGEYAGIPGVTKPSRPWCVECVKQLIQPMIDWYVSPPRSTAATRYNYAVAVSELVRISPVARHHLSKIVPPSTLTARPLWDRWARTQDNRLFVVWSSLIDRCIDYTNPNYSNWGGDGWTVSPRWKDFDKFVMDMPPEFDVDSDFTVIPNGFSKELGPKSTLVSKGGHSK